MGAKEWAPTGDLDAGHAQTIAALGMTLVDNARFGPLVSAFDVDYFHYSESVVDVALALEREMRPEKGDPEWTGPTDFFATLSRTAENMVKFSWAHHGEPPRGRQAAAAVEIVPLGLS